jgi:hypothetical protein
VALTDTFWRAEGGRGNQSEALAQKQQSSMKMCGYGANQAGGGVSPIPAVKAYYGSLPKDARGIEFRTAVEPYSINRVQGGLATWPRGHAGVVDDPHDDDMVCIPIVSIMLQY